jgi:dihydropteroate synthase
MFTLNLQGNLFTIDTPLIMGILNLTKDSFSDGGKWYGNTTKAVEHTQEMIAQGAEIIDIGASSTRPGAQMLSAKEELEQILPVLKEIRNNFPQIPISIDTVWSEVAQITIENGANIINDISAGVWDTNLFATVAQLECPYILMHSSITKGQIHNPLKYNDIVLEISKFFSQKITILRSLGVKDIILDLGIGFGKTIEENYYLLNHIADFRIFDMPILTGISRKSFIFKTLGITPQEATNGTTFLHFPALEGGSNILRVHDVKQASECVKLFQSVKQNL